MRPLSLRLQDFGSFSDCTIPLSDASLVAICGENGAGKSTILTAIRVALFGSSAGALDGFVRQGAPGFRLMFVFEVAGVRYNIVREHGKAQKASLVKTLNFSNGVGLPVCEAKVRDVDAAIITILGCDHAGFTLAHHLPQGRLGEFASIDPAARQAWLAANMPLSMWGELESEAKSLIAISRDALSSAESRERVLESMTTDIGLDEQELAVIEAELEQKRTALARTEAIAEAATKTDARRAVLESELVSAQARARKCAVALASMPANVPDEEPDIARYEARLAWYQEFERLYAKFREAERASDAASDARTAFVMQKKPHCPLCKQAVRGPAYDETLERLVNAAKVAGEAQMLADAALPTHAAAGGALKCIAPSDSQEAHNAALAASDALAGAREMSRAYALRAQMDSLLLEQHETAEIIKRVSAALSRMPDSQEARDAVASIKELHTALDSLSRRAATLTANIAKAKDAQEAIATARLDADAARSDIDILTMLAKAYGRTGIVARIVEGAVESIEDHANDFLARFTDGMTLEMRTQRENKTGGLRETLDIFVTDSSGTRAIENYSGGEQTRVNFALAVGLARFLSSHHSGEIESFIVDEPEFLDARGVDELVRCLHILSSSVPFVGVVSHIPAVAGAMPQTIEVAKHPAGSVAKVVES